MKDRMYDSAKTLIDRYYLSLLNVKKKIDIHTINLQSCSYYAE